MYQNRSFIGKKNFLKSLATNRLSPVITAYADDGEEKTVETTPPTINYENLVAQARKEEKDKLYPRIKKLEEENATLLKNSNDSLLKVAALTQELENARAEGSAKSSKEVEALNAKITELEAQLEEAKKSAVNEEEVRAKVEKEYAVKLYIRDKVAENKDSILTILAEDITGATEEEVDKAIEAAKEKTLAVKKDLGLVDEEGKPVSTPQKKDEKPSTKKPPVVNPPMEKGGSELSVDYIRGLDPRSPEYAEVRKKLGLR